MYPELQLARLFRSELFADDDRYHKFEKSTDENGLTIFFDVPGCLKEDITVECTGRNVYVAAKKSVGTSKSISQTFVVNESYDVGSMTAKYDAGVLHLKIPKKEGSQKRKIEVT